MPPLSQDNRPIQFRSVREPNQSGTVQGWDNPANLRCLRVELNEALCRPFHAEIDLCVSQDLLDDEKSRYLSGALWKLFDLSLDTRGETATSEFRRLRGLVTAFTDLGPVDLPFPGRHVRLVFEPEVVRLRQQVRSWAHTGSLSDIFSSLFGGLQRAYLFQDEKTKAPIHQKTQLDESDLDFFMRLVEEYGLTWFLAGEGDEQKVVVCDNPHHFLAVSAFQRHHDTSVQVPHIGGHHSRHKAGKPVENNRVGAVRFGMRVPVAKFISHSRDSHDFQRLSSDTQSVQFNHLPEEISQASPDKCPDGCRNAGDAPWMPDHDWITNPPDTSAWRETQARAMRLEATREACRAFAGEIDGSIALAGAGCLLRLEDHSFLQQGRPIDFLHQGRPIGQAPEYYVTKARLIASHMPEGPEGDPTWVATSECAYRKQNSLTVLPAGQPFAPEPVTARPRILGPRTARVAGSAGVADNRPDLHRHGSVLLDFAWLPGESVPPRRARVAQFWAGAGYGAMFWPRTGHEVVVVFEDGDPDRPLVVGSLYNGVNPPPEADFGVPYGWVSGIISSPLIQGDVKSGMANYIKIYDDRNCQVATHSVTTTVNYSSANQYTLHGGGGLTITGSIL